MRWRVVALGSAGLLLAAGLAGLGLPRLTARFAGGAAPRAPVVLRLLERDTHVLEYAPLTEHPAPAWVAADGSGFVPRRADHRPSPRTRAVALFEIWAGGMRVFGDAHLVDRLPGTIPIDRPPVWMGTTRTGRRVNILAPGGRVLPGVLTLLDVAADGTVTLGLAGRPVVLAPGERWAGAWARYPDGERALPGGEEWDAAVDDALAAAVPLTILTVENLGRVPLGGGP